MHQVWSAGRLQHYGLLLNHIWVEPHLGHDVDGGAEGAAHNAGLLHTNSGSGTKRYQRT